MEESWVVVYITTYPQNIYMAQNLLESEGIDTFIKDELTAQIHNFFSTAIGGVKLMVPGVEARRAYSLLVEGGYIKP